MKTYPEHLDLLRDRVDAVVTHIELDFTSLPEEPNTSLDYELDMLLHKAEWVDTGDVDEECSCTYFNLNH